MTTSLTRADLVTALAASRVTVVAVQRGRVRVAIDYGQRTTLQTVPEEWMRCEAGRRAVERWRQAQASEVRR